MIRNREYPDRLYLSQGEDNIYIDEKVPDHHIEGIRFLYRQFKRKRPGVIINDPYGCGRNLLITLFLKAIRSLLYNPVLVVCQEGDQHDWVDRFDTWTDLYDEIEIATSRPLVKKLIIINAMVNLPAYCSREWSIVVIDGERITNTNQILKLPFKADFKIWNTPVSMKDNLNKFGEIYSWMYPNESFDQDYFIPNHESAVDVIEKTILLDSFMEDIVIRRDDLNASYEKFDKEVFMPLQPGTVSAVSPFAVTAVGATSATTVSTTTTTSLAIPPPLPPTPAPAPPTVTRKNKDATGTKIKRSKTRTESETKPPAPPVAAALVQLIEQSSKHEPDDTTEDFSIANYHKMNKEMHKTGESHVKIIEIDNTDSQYLKPNTQTQTAGKLEEMDTLVFGHDTFISKITDETHGTSSKTIEPQTIVTCKPINKQNKRVADETAAKKSNTISKLSEIIEREKKNDGRCILPKKRKLSLDTVYPETSDSTINLDTLNKEIRNLGASYDKKMEQNVNEIKVTNDINKEISDLNMTDKEQAGNSRKHTLDDKMKECEEKVSKKFKGSFLDRLF